MWRVIQLKEGNSVRCEISEISFEGSSSRVGTSKKTATGCGPGQSVAGRRKSAFGLGPKWPKL